MKTCKTCGQSFAEDAFYFNNKKRGIRLSSCKTCTKTKHAQAYLENREERLEKASSYYRENRESVLSRTKQRRDANRESVRKYDRQWYKHNSESVILRQREYYRKNAKAIYERQKKWRKKNHDKLLEQNRRQRARYPLKSRAIVHRRLARLKAAPGRFADKDIVQIWHRQSGLCVYCDTPLGTHPLENGAYEIDHRCPLSKGGSNWPRNLQLLCQGCNRRKADKYHAAFRYGR